VEVSINMKIGIDVDEVLAEQLKSLVEFYRDRTGVFVPKEKFHSYYWPDIWGISLEEAVKIDIDFKETDLFDNLEVVEGSVDAINILRYDHELVIITARPKRFKDKTLKWLDSNFGNLFSNIFHSCDFHVDNGDNKNKSDICEDLGVDILIEDSVNNSLDCAKRGLVVLLLDKPWNQGVEHKNIYRCFSWEDILGKIKEIENV